MNIDRFGHNSDIEYHKFGQKASKVTHNFFNRHFFTGFWILWVFSGLLSLGMLGAFLYVAWHFLAKVW